MPLWVKKYNQAHGNSWASAQNLWVKTGRSPSTNLWKKVQKVWVKTGSYWVQAWPKSGPYTTTSPYISSNTAGTQFFTVGDPIYSYASNGTTSVVAYGQIGTWKPNVTSGYSSVLTYSYETKTATSSSSNVLTSVISPTTISSSYASIPISNSAYDGKYLIFIVNATNSAGIVGSDDTDSGKYRYLICKRQPTPASPAPSITIDTSAVSTYSFTYTSYWNGTPGYTPDSTKSSVVWYSSMVGTYSTVDQIKTNGTLIVGGITTTTPTNDGTKYTVTSVFSQTASTILDGTYFYAIDTQENTYKIVSGTSYNQFAKSQIIAKLPGPVDAYYTYLTYTGVKIFWSTPTNYGSPIDYYEYNVNSTGWNKQTYPGDLFENLTLTPNTNYSVRVRAHNAAGSGTDGLAASFTTLAYVAPGTPSPTASNITYTTATVSWTAPSAGSSAIDLYEYNVNSTGWNSNGTNLSVNLTLSPNTSYSVQVRAHNNTGGYGSAGSTSSFKTLTYTAPGTPSPSASNVSYTTATVSWTAPSAGSSAIDLYEYAINGSGWVSNGTSTTINFTGLTPNTAYSVKVRAHNNTGGYGSEGIAPTFNTLAYVAPGAVNASASNVSYTTATISWTAPSAGSSAIDLYEYNVNSTGWNSNGTNLSVNLTLSANTTYVIQVRAHNNTGGYGSAGSTSSFKTLTYTAPGTPSPSASNVTTTTATVSWSAVSDGGQPPVTYLYSITGGSIGGTDSYTSSGIVLSGTTYSVNFTLPNANTTFTVKVKATNSIGSTIGQTSFTTPSNPKISSISYAPLGNFGTLYTSASANFTGNTDDGYWTFVLPYTITYNGTVYDKIYVGTNSYITFGSGSTVYSPSASSPAFDKILVWAADRSSNSVYWYSTSSVWNIKLNCGLTSGTPGTGIQWELYNNNANGTKRLDVTIVAGSGGTTTAASSSTSFSSLGVNGTAWSITSQ